jgi:hypothetical protein
MGEDDLRERIEVGGCLLTRRGHEEARGDGAGRLREVIADALCHQYAVACGMKDTRKL